MHVNFRIPRTSIKGILRMGGNHEIWYSVPYDSRAKVLSIRFTVGHGFLRTRLTGDCKGSMGAKGPKPQCLSCWVKEPNSRKRSEGLLNKRVALLVQMTFTAQQDAPLSNFPRKMQIPGESSSLGPEMCPRLGTPGTMSSPFVEAWCGLQCLNFWDMDHQNIPTWQHGLCLTGELPWMVSCLISH